MIIENFIQNFLVLDEKRLMYEKQFLTDIVLQNYTKYDIKVTEWVKNHTIPGQLLILTPTQTSSNLLRAAMAIFKKDFHEPFLRNEWKLHSPIMEIDAQNFSKGKVSKNIYNNFA